MQTFQRIWRYLQQHRLASLVFGHVCVLLVLATLFFGSGISSSIRGAFAQSHCASGDQAYVVKRGDTLGAIAAHYGTSTQTLVTYNHISNPSLIYVNETVCIPKKTTASGPPKGRSNPFPYGQCTWWADQRYAQIHGFYVPWTTQSNAMQWTARAQQFSWHVSSQPSVGAIIVLQPWVQGAYGLGHVAVVERVLANKHVIASNMDWGSHPSQVVDVQFSPGSGVMFINY